MLKRISYLPGLAVLALAACQSVGAGQYVGRQEFDTLTQRVSEVEARVGLPPWGGGLPTLVSSSPPSAVLAGGPGQPAPSPVPTPTPSPMPAQAQPPVSGLLPPPGYRPDAANGGERASYQEGQRLVKARQYDRAAGVFTRLLTENPSGALAPNARYWLGECFYAQGRFGEAATEFRRCADEYPLTEKASDSLLKLSFCHDRLGDGPQAMAAMEQLLSRYPDSSAARMVKSGQANFKG